MDSKPNHITELFKQYAELRQNSLRRTDTAQKSFENRMLKHLLDRFHLDADVAVLSLALSDPYFPIGMLEQTIFADVVGMRFFINKKRWDLEPVLARDSTRRPNPVQSGHHYLYPVRRYPSSPPFGPVVQPLRRMLSDRGSTP